MFLSNDQRWSDLSAKSEERRRLMVSGVEPVWNSRKLERRMDEYLTGMEEKYHAAV